MNKIFKTTLVLVSLIAGFGYAEKARYDNEDEDEEMEYDYGKSQAEIKEETHRVYGTFFEKRRYGIKVAMNISPIISKKDVEIGDGGAIGIGIITSIPVSEDGPFKIESGIEFYEVLEMVETYSDGIYDHVYEAIRIPVLLDYYPLSLTAGVDGQIVMVNFKGGVFFDFKYDRKDDEDREAHEGSKSIFFDSPGVIFTFGFRTHRDEGPKSFSEHMGLETGISYKNSKFRLNVNWAYLF